MEAQRLVDRRRQLADVDSAGLGQVALSDTAGERLRLVPYLQCEGDAGLDVMALRRRGRAGPILQRRDRLGLGHAFDAHEPVDAVAVLAAGMAVEMIGVDAAARLPVF